MLFCTSVSFREFCVWEHTPPKLGKPTVTRSLIYATIYIIYIYYLILKNTDLTIYFTGVGRTLRGIFGVGIGAF